MGNTFSRKKQHMGVVARLPPEEQLIPIIDPDRWPCEVLPSCHAALRMTMFALNVMPWEDGTPDTFVPWDALEDLMPYLSHTVYMYAVGGVDGGDNMQSTVECYNPATNVWAAVAPMATARFRHGVATVGGFLYAVGGNTQSTVECYNPATNVWAVVAPMATARRGHGTATGFL